MYVCRAIHTYGPHNSKRVRVFKQTVLYLIHLHIYGHLYDTISSASSVGLTASTLWSASRGDRQWAHSRQKGARNAIATITPLPPPPLLPPLPPLPPPPPPPLRPPFPPPSTSFTSNTSHHHFLPTATSTLRFYTATAASSNPSDSGSDYWADGRSTRWGEAFPHFW